MMSDVRAWALSVVGIMSLSLAQAGFFHDHARGWHWYEMKPLPVPQKPSPKRPLTPSQQVASYKKELEQRLHLALLQPTFEHVKSYQTLQQAWMNQSQRFADMWKTVVFQTPNLDETIQHPHMQGARHIYYDRHHQNQEKRLKELAKTYGLFLFVKGACGYCHAFAPVVQAFTKRYGFSLMVVSVDGGTVPGLVTVPDNGIAHKLGITTVPSLYAVNPTTHHTVPLSHGMVADEEIKERLLFMTNRRKA